MLNKASSAGWMTGAMEGKTSGVMNQKLIDKLIASIVTGRLIPHISPPAAPHGESLNVSYESQLAAEKCALVMVVKRLRTVHRRAQLYAYLRKICCMYRSHAANTVGFASASTVKRPPSPLPDFNCIFRDCLCRATAGEDRGLRGLRAWRP